MKILVVTVISLVFFLDLHAQTKEYENLLSVAFGKYDQIFVHKTPIQVSFREKNIHRIVRNFKRYYDTDLDVDTNIMAELIQNSEHVDTTAWVEEELPKFLLVSSRTEIVSNKYAVNKLSLIDKKQVKLCKKRIRQFNFTQNFDRDIFYFSRPIFDNSKSFAIIKWDNGHSGLLGGGGIVLYQQMDNKWTIVGALEHWAH